MSESEQSAASAAAAEEEEAVAMKQAEMSEEMKLKAKYPQVQRPGGSLFLQKRLQKGQKYFDSGDYNMAKAKGQKSRTALLFAPQQSPTGETIPTPDSVPARKASVVVQSKLATGSS